MADRFALDQNFPHAVVRLEWPPTIEIVELPRFAPRLVRDREDWEILQELHDRGDAAGFITNDAGMLNQPKEMVVLSRSRLVLVVTVGVGNNALRATGLVMVHLQAIAHRATGAPQIVQLRPGNATPRQPGQRINVLAARRQVTPPELIRETRAEIADLRRRRGG